LISWSSADGLIRQILRVLMITFMCVGVHKGHLMPSHKISCESPSPPRTINIRPALYRPRPGGLTHAVDSSRSLLLSGYVDSGISVAETLTLPLFSQWFGQNRTLPSDNSPIWSGLNRSSQRPEMSDSRSNLWINDVKDNEVG